MRRILLPGLVCLLPALAWSDDERRGGVKDRTPPIAVSGEVVVRSIDIQRKKVSFAAKEADLTNMSIDLWFASKWKGGDKEDYLVRLKSLSPLVDDTGAVLSTERRLDAINELQGEARSSTYQSFMGKGGPILTMIFDAPARRADAIRSLKGEAEVTRFRRQTILFDATKINGKPLSHESFKGMDVRPSVKAEDGDTTLTLRVRKGYARILDFGISTGGERLKDYLAMGRSDVRDGDGVDLTRDYSGKLPKKYSLAVKVAVPVETKTFAFDFGKIDLP